MKMGIKNTLCEFV